MNQSNLTLILNLILTKKTINTPNIETQNNSTISLDNIPKIEIPDTENTKNESKIIHTENDKNTQNIVNTTIHIDNNTNTLNTESKTVHNDTQNENTKKHNR